MIYDDLVIMAVIRDKRTAPRIVHTKPGVGYRFVAFACIRVENDMTTTLETSSHQHHKLAPLALGALGVVYDDIGTSPLYTIKTALH